MIVYADTSALAKLLIDETGSAQIGAVRQSADSIATAAIAYVELRAAAAAAVRAHRVAPPQQSDLMSEVDLLWGELSPIGIDYPLLRNAGDFAERFALRAYDAVHLAALQVTGPPDSVVFACWDSDLRRAASSLGYTLVPA